MKTASSYDKISNKILLLSHSRFFERLSGNCNRVLTSKKNMCFL